MGFTNSRASLLIVVLTIALAAGGLRAPLARAQDDEQRFAALLAQRDSTESLAAPLSGELVQQEGFSTINAAGVEATDFSATATFENPTQSGELSWDFGFVFHQTADTGQQVIVDSAGFWYYAPYPDGTPASGFAEMVDNSPGATNTIDLVVAGETALLGINGQFVTSIALPPTVASDVLVGTGFYSNTTEPGRTVGYLDFAVWPLSGEPTPVTESEESPQSIIEIEESPPTVEAEETPQSIIEVEGTPRSTVEPEETPAADIVPVTPEAQTESAQEPEPDVTPASEPATDAEAFALLLELQTEVEPISGPFTANLKEEEARTAQSWAGVNLVDLHAQATFDVPQSTSDTPWDIGLTFRTSPSGPLKIAVDSLGNWYYSIGDQGPTSQGTLSGVAVNPGGANTIDLFVAEQGAVFGVNGAFVARIDLPPDSASGDIAAGTGYYSDQTLIDRITPFRDFTIRPFDPNVPAPTSPTEGELAPADIEAFNGYLAGTEAAAPAVGPFAGRLVESSPGVVSQAAAGIVLADFGALAAFSNPDDIATALWDAGIQFRANGDLTHRVILRSTGEIFAVQADGATTVVGTASAYDATPGALNALQLFVRGDQALVGVNGELAAVIDLSAEPFASDILVGAAFFGEDFVQGRVTSYEGFSVWEIT